MAEYTKGRDRLHMAYSFDMLGDPFTPAHFRSRMTDFFDAAPDGWPVSGATPVEHWADCVARAFTGNPLGSHQQAPCDGDSYRWTADWLSQGPGAHVRTG